MRNRFSGGIVIAGWKKLVTCPGCPRRPKARCGSPTRPADGIEHGFPAVVREWPEGRTRAPNADAKKYWHDLAKWDPRNRLAFVSASEIGNWHNLKRVEMFLQQSWENHMRKSIKPAADGMSSRYLPAARTRHRVLQTVAVVAR